MKVADVLRILGWYWVRGAAVHCGERRQFKHPKKPGRLTVAGNADDSLAPGALESILKQSGYMSGHTQ
jgi:predicted RNA binding protein YcfA (HicA-like mRNA interferase family)